MIQRFRPQQRVRRPQDFQTICKKGKFLKGKFLNIWCCESAEAPEGPKLGLIVTRKVNTRATQRNLWRRRIRESFRLMQEEIKNNMAFVVQARKLGEAPPLREISDEMKEMLAKAGFLK